jgi:hypothetical protein
MPRKPVLDINALDRLISITNSLLVAERFQNLKTDPSSDHLEILVAH